MNKPTYVGSSDVIAVEVDDGAYEGFSSSKIKSLISERDSLINILNSKSQINTPIKNDDRIINQLKGDIQKKEEQIATLNIRIDELNQEVSTLKSNQNTGGYTQSDIDAKDKTIRSLNSEISRLRNQIKEKDRLINALNEQIGVINY